MKPRFATLFVLYMLLGPIGWTVSASKGQETTMPPRPYDYDAEKQGRSIDVRVQGIARVGNDHQLFFGIS